MNRIITPNSLVVGVLVLVALAVTGCGGRYPRKEFAPDSDEAVRIQDMVRELRAATTEQALAKVIARQVIPESDADHSKRALAVFGVRKIASSKDVKFLLFDRYGNRLYRVNLRLIHDDHAESMSMLLILGDDGALRWAGPN